MRVHVGRGGKRRVHDDGRGRDVVKLVGDGFRVEGGGDRLREEPGQEAGASLRVFVQMEIVCGPVAHRAFGHHRQHAGAGRGFQHGVAGPDGGGLQGGIGQRQRRRELLEADLFLGALGMRRLQCGDRRQHPEHGAGAVLPGACPAAHGAAVALDEQQRRRLRPPRRRPSRATRPRCRTCRRHSSSHRGGSRHRGAYRPPGPAADSGRPRTGRRPRPGGPAMRAGRWRAQKGADARARPAPDGRRAWRSPCWNGVKPAGRRDGTGPPAPRRRTAPGRLAGLRQAQGAVTLSGGIAAGWRSSGR